MVCRKALKGKLVAGVLLSCRSELADGSSRSVDCADGRRGNRHHRQSNGERPSQARGGGGDGVGRRRGRGDTTSWVAAGVLDTQPPCHENSGLPHGSPVCP